MTATTRTVARQTALKWGYGVNRLRTLWNIGDNE